MLKHCPSFHTIMPADSDLLLTDSGSDGTCASLRHASLLSGLDAAEIGVDDVLALHQAVPLLKVGIWVVGGGLGGEVRWPGG